MSDSERIVLLEKKVAVLVEHTGSLHNSVTKTNLEMVKLFQSARVETLQLLKFIAHLPGVAGTSNHQQILDMVARAESKADVVDAMITEQLKSIPEPPDLRF